MVFKRLKNYGEMVMFSHTLFSLPFTLASMLLAGNRVPELPVIILITAAFTGARTAANALNRIIDRDIDAKNPRTRGRHIPSGRVSMKEAYAVTALSGVVLAASAWLLRPLCFYLLPLAGFVFILYSYSKRFTFFSHLILGAACAGGTLGAWIAVTGGISLSSLVLTSANALWVSGFDIIYSTQDTDFDRQENLYSVPAMFGKRVSMFVSAGSHILTILFLFVFSFMEKRGLFFHVGTASVLVLLFTEHFIAWRRKNKIETASYSINKLIGVLFLVFTFCDVYFSGGIN